MLKINKKIILILISLFLIFNTYVYAESKDSGSINFIAINDSNSEKIANLTIDVYQIGKTIDGTFVFNNLYQNINIENYSKSNIENIKNIAVNNDKPIFTETTDNEGKINFENIELGTYLFVQSNNKENIQMQTMLIKIPEASENSVNYNITIKPKISIKEKNVEEKLDNRIPYTGVLNWPIPVLAISAMIIFCIGWFIIYSKKNKKKLGYSFIIISVILLISSAILLINNINSEKRIEDENKNVVTSLEEDIEKNQNIVENEDNINYNIIDQETIKNINNTNYIGILYFPTISNLAVSVTENLDNINLKKGSCRYYGELKNNNLIIGGHNYKSIFGKLDKELKLNDTIYFKELSGKVSKFIYKEKQILRPNQVEELVKTDYDLTLFTCTYDNINRIAFRFEQIY